MTVLFGNVWLAGFGVPFVSNAPQIASRGFRLRPSPRRPCRHHLHKYGYGWALVPPASVGYRASLVGLAVGFDIRFVWKFCVGEGCCVRPPLHVTITVSRRIFLFVRQTRVSFVLG